MFFHVVAIITPSIIKKNIYKKNFSSRDHGRVLRKSSHRIAWPVPWRTLGAKTGVVCALIVVVLAVAVMRDGQFGTLQRRNQMARRYHPRAQLNCEPSSTSMAAMRPGRHPRAMTDLDTESRTGNGPRCALVVRPCQLQMIGRLRSFWTMTMTVDGLTASPFSLS